MGVIALVSVCLVASHFLIIRAAADCAPLSYNAIAQQINSDLPFTEGDQPSVNAIFYTCFAHGTDPRTLRSFAVTVNTTADISPLFHYLFQCRSSPMTYFLQSFSSSASTVANVTFDSYCSSCQNSHPVCQPCDSSCVNKRCSGSTASDCCNYFKNDMCVVDCGTNFVPNAEDNCVCANNFTGANCSVCSLACQNGEADSTCSSCICSVGYTGHVCSVQLSGCDSNPCMNRGTCTRTNEGGFSCSCPSGYTGPVCSVQVNGCDSNPCRNRGTCTRTNEGGFSCSCPSGYTGSVCSVQVNDCDSNPCRNRGTCARANEGGFSCSCPSGYTDSVCGTAVDVDACIPNPCQNGGICSDAAVGFSCQCAAGYQGSDCSMDVNGCDIALSCMNGGRCVNVFGRFTCDCQPGFRGSLCDTPSDVCSKNIAYCGDNGNCKTEVYCPEAYCRELELEPDETNGQLSYCLCENGFYGDRCSHSLSSCDGSPCVNGDCSQVGGNVQCQCSGNWAGTVCDDCSLPCVYGSVDEGCSACICHGNWTGNSCSECIDLIQGTECVKSCASADHLPYTDSRGRHWCFACGIFLCDQCNYNDVEEESQYRCKQCVPGARLDHKNEGHCTSEPDVQDDTSSGNNIGLIVGLTIGLLALAVIVFIVACVIYQKKSSVRGGYKISEQAMEYYKS